MAIGQCERLECLKFAFREHGGHNSAITSETHERALRFWRHGIEDLQELPHAQFAQ